MYHSLLQSGSVLNLAFNKKTIIEVIEDLIGAPVINKDLSGVFSNIGSYFPRSYHWFLNEDSAEDCELLRAMSSEVSGIKKLGMCLLLRDPVLTLILLRDSWFFLK